MTRPVIGLALLLTAMPLAAAPRVTHPFASSVPRGAVQRVVIDIPAGDVTVRNGAADTLAVKGSVSRDPDSDRSAPVEQAIVNDTSVEIYVSGGEAVVRRRFGPNARSWRAERFSTYDVNLTLPPGVALDFRTTAGDIDVDGDFADVDVDLRAGDVKLRLPNKNVRELNASARVGQVHTRVGDEIIQREGLFPGKTQYRNLSGRSTVNVHVTAGEVDVELY